MPSNISLQSVCDYVLTNVRGAPIQDVLGVQNEPALSICNDVYQEVLQRPLTWRFNKANNANTGLGVLYFTTTAFQQDYSCTNASASVSTVGVVHIATVANSGVVVAAGTATVKTQWPHGFTAGKSVTLLNVGQWSGGVFTADSSGNINATFTIASAPTATSFTFSTAATAGTYGAPGINDIGWIERCVLEDFANTGNVKPRHSIEVTMNLELESIIQPPFKISYQYTVADSTIAAGQLVASVNAVFRLWPVPSQQIWGVMIDYQLKPQTFTDLSNPWGVWPDELIFVIRQGVRAFALDFVEDPRATTEYQLFMKKLDQVREIRDQERPSQTMFPDRPLMYGG
jgi:hypothetical protein